MNDLSRTPRRRLRDLVTPLGPDGRLDEHGSFLQRGASDIYREQGERMIVVKFDIHDRDLAGAVAEAKEATKDLVHAPCRLSWARRIPGDGAGRIAPADRHPLGRRPWWPCCCTWRSVPWSTC